MNFDIYPRIPSGFIHRYFKCESQHINDSFPVLHPTEAVSHEMTVPDKDTRINRGKWNGVVTRNGIFRPKWRNYGPTGDILDYQGTLIFWFIIILYPIKG